jgi:hypothetical protein
MEEQVILVTCVVELDMVKMVYAVFVAVKALECVQDVMVKVPLFAELVMVHEGLNVFLNMKFISKFFKNVLLKEGQNILRKIHNNYEDCC